MRPPGEISDPERRRPRCAGRGAYGGTRGAVGGDGEGAARASLGNIRKEFSRRVL